MILVAIEIENYKQYAGFSRIEFPRQGIVAITGLNGAGKTTLFEAIEWCLYCPRSISQASIPPHDGVGKTVVRLTLEDGQDGKQYTVVRELRGAGTRAEVYAEDEPWQPLVQGTREVTQFVARKLVGLPHNAFVSTFFTKQRELQMFGDLSPTNRRVEVAKLLGLEAVREAQSKIGEERVAAKSLADALRAEYTRRIAGRDLDHEVEGVGALVEQAERSEHEAESQLLIASDGAARARAELDAQRDLQERDADIQRALAAEVAALAKARAQLAASTRELARLQQRAADRAQLLELADQIPVHEREVGQHELERSRAERAMRLREIAQRSEDSAVRVTGRLQTLLADHARDATGLLPWGWSNFEVEDCIYVTEQVGKAISELDVRSLHARLEAMQQTSQRQAAIDGLDQKLSRYGEFREQLQRERRDLIANGDPAELVEFSLQSVHEAREVEQRERVALTKARDAHESNRQLAQTLRNHHDAAICPTCSRPLNAGEVDLLIAALEPQLDILEAEAKRLESAVVAAEARVASAVQEEREARATTAKLRTLNGRLQDGEALIRETELQRDAECEFMHRMLREIGADQPPSSSEVEQARATAERAQRIASLAGTVRGLGEQAREARVTSQEARVQLDELGEVFFDEHAMRAAADKLQASRRAAALVEQIEVELAHQDAYERERDQSQTEIARATAVESTLTADRAALGFDPARLADVQRSDREARASVDMLREAHASALREAREARRDRERVLEEVQLLRRLMEEADVHERQADELTRMYEEFREFDRYVARQVGPLLSESTERMLGHVTNGKFDQVRFDENYGIEIFDGDEAFPMSTFSGGERDVVALCARLALSEIVGSAALRPPQFLVLDEVFGSLDSDRRGQLLEMLGGLAHSGYFRQMFIISHVDDVQQSPVMNEAWRIEDSDGVSRIIQPTIDSV